MSFLSQFPRSIDSPEEMIAFGKQVAESLASGSVLALCGGLGAGKTHFTKGVAQGLDCDAVVTSPTFALAHEYGDGRQPLYHFDFYRMESADEVLRMGWDEYLDDAAVVVVEWPDRFPHLLPPGTYWIDFSVDGESRILTAKVV